MGHRFSLQTVGHFFGLGFLRLHDSLCAPRGLNLKPLTGWLVWRFNSTE
jgi:hypothetical protein